MANSQPLPKIRGRVAMTALPLRRNSMLAKYMEADFCGRKLYLAYTVSAMFDINDLLEENQELVDVLSATERENLGQFCCIIKVLADYGENIRKVEGITSKEPSITKEQLLTYMSPVEYLNLKKAAMNAVMAGYGREIVDEEKEIDLGLVELQKKRDQPGHI